MVHNTHNFDLITIQFHVNCKTKFGQNLFISGNCSQLGNWTPYAGIKLETNRTIYPQWSTSHPIILKANTFIQFKACIIKDSTVVWQHLPQNHLLLTGSKSMQIYMDFDSSFVQIYEKKVVEIECRDKIDNIMNDMQSDWGSSIGHPSNYPLERFHMIQRGAHIINRSQISSNLMSGTDSEQIQLQIKILNYLNPRSLIKTLSKPSEYQRKNYAKKLNETRYQMKIISQGSQTGNQSPKRRSYRSLPKDYNFKTQKAIFGSRVQARKSFPTLFKPVQSKQKSRTTNQNTETLISQRERNYNKKQIKVSLLSQSSSQTDQNSDYDDQVQDLFGFEIF